MKDRSLIRILIVAFVLAQVGLGWAFYREFGATGEAVEALQEGATGAFGSSQSLEATSPSDEIDDARREARRAFEQVTGQLRGQVTTAEMVEQLEGAGHKAGCDLLSVTVGDVQECRDLAIIPVQTSIMAPDTPTLLRFVQHVEEGELNMLVELPQLAFFSEHRAVTLPVQVRTLPGGESP